jgi:hypothetical protein
MITEKRLESFVQENREHIGSAIAISHRIPDHVAKDTRLALLALSDQGRIGVSALAVGLKMYYMNGHFNGYNDMDLFFGPHGQMYREIMERTEGLPVIVQMQKLAHVKDQDDELPNALDQTSGWKRVVVNTWEELARSEGYDTLYWIPAHLNLYLLPIPRIAMRDIGHEPPREESLKLNYDYEAKRRGFRQDDSLFGIFKKELKQ